MKHLSLVLIPLLLAVGCSSEAPPRSTPRPNGKADDPIRLSSPMGLEYFAGTWACDVEAADGSGFAVDLSMAEDGAIEAEYRHGREGTASGTQQATGTDFRLDLTELRVLEAEDGRRTRQQVVVSMSSDGWRYQDGEHVWTWAGQLDDGVTRPTEARITFIDCGRFRYDWDGDLATCTRSSDYAANACETVEPIPPTPHPEDDAAVEPPPADAGTADAATSPRPDAGPPSSEPDAGAPPPPPPPPPPPEDWTVPPTGCVSGAAGPQAVCAPEGWSSPRENDPCNFQCWGSGWGYAPCVAPGGRRGWQFCWRHSWQPLNQGQWGVCEAAPASAPGC